MTVKTIKDLFSSDIFRRIEEVIKVDQTDEEVIRDEFHEYVVTDSIRRHFMEVLESYWATFRTAHEGIAIWVSGLLRFREVKLCEVPGPCAAEPTNCRQGCSRAAGAAHRRPEGGGPAAKHC